MIDDDEVHVMQGALAYKTKHVSEVMTPADDVFMISAETPLDFQALALSRATPTRPPGRPRTSCLPALGRRLPRQPLLPRFVAVCVDRANHAVGSFLRRWALADDRLFF